MQAILHDKRLKTVSRRHPWIFSKAIRRFEDNPTAGDIVTLRSEDGTFLGKGFWNQHSTIRMRMLTWEEEVIDDAFWRRRLQAALSLRGKVPANHARRLINAENDYLPGLVVDQYGDWLVFQALVAGMEQRKDLLADLLMDIVKPSGIYERSDADARQREGLRLDKGGMRGEEPPNLIEIQENDHRFLVDVRDGHKTGFYLDQRVNRQLLAEHMPQDARVLNCFSYTGAFGVYAYGAGASQVTSVDSSYSALELAEENFELNGFDDVPLVSGDVFDVLRDYKSQGETFDVIVLDPPKFAKNARQVESSLRGYKDINLNALQLLNPGGLLMTFSCSGGVSPDLFRKVVFGALEDSGREAQVLRTLDAPPDHPVALTFPEGEYLKGLLCRVL